MRTRTRTSVLVSVLLLLTAFSGVSPSVAAAEPGAVGDPAPAIQESAATCEFPATVTDATGTEVTVEERPERVTTLSPSAAQTMWEIGGKSQVVGVTRYAAYLEGADAKTNVSSSGDAVISAEKVVGTEPDLVLAPNVVPNETVSSLRDAGLTVVKFEAATSIDDVRNKTTLIGNLTGNCEGAAATNEWMQRNVRAAENATADAERPAAIHALGGGYVAGDQTFVDSMLVASGATNVAAEANVTGFAKLSDERVAELNPEAVVVTYSGAVDLSAEPWASTPAGENNATVVVDANYLNQPAPRSVVYGVRNMTEAFHPDAYGQAEFVTRAQVSGNASAGTTSATQGGNESTADDSAEAGAQTTADNSAATTGVGEGGDTATDDATTADSPGFGVGVAAVALLLSGLLASRRD